MVYIGLHNIFLHYLTEFIRFFEGFDKNFGNLGLGLDKLEDTV